MINILRLDHVQICIPINKENEARHFYKDILQFKEIEKPDALKPNGGMWFSVGDIELHIGVEAMEATKGKRHPAFEVEDIEEVRKYLNKKRVPIFEETPIPNIIRFSIYDPFGNRIEFLERKKAAKN